MGKGTPVETIVTYKSGDALHADLCDLCSDEAVTIVASVSEHASGVFVLKGYGLCKAHADLLSRVLSGEIHVLEQINYEKATKKIINLRG
jgi:hypothetical protein